MKKTIVGIGEILWDCFPEYRRLGGELIDRAQKVATRVAAFVCTQAGATPLIPDELKA